MRIARATILLIFVALAVGSSTAEAKETRWLLTGGELGDAAFVFSLTDFGADANDGLTDGARLVPPPEQPRGPIYDLYVSSGFFAVALEMQEGPHLQYASELGWLRLPKPTSGLAAGWYELPPHTRTLLTAAVREAQEERDAGRLAADPVAADLRDRGLVDAAFAFIDQPPEGLGTRAIETAIAALRRRPEEAADILPPQSAAFADELRAVIQQPLAGQSTDAGAVLILLYQATDDGAAVEGAFARYDPPEGDRAGRLWAGSYVNVRDTTGAVRREPVAAYWETTPAFDDLVAGRGNGTGAFPTTGSGGLASPESDDVALWAALATAVMTLGLGILAHFVLRRQRRGELSG